KGHGKDKDKDKERVVSQTPAETAKVITPKITADEGGMEDSDRAAGEPTSGPTFESISPKESSRNKRTNVDARSRGSAPMAATTRTAAPNSAGERSLIRALGLKIGKIVVDAGHGGHDTGTIGPNGLQEKDLVLDVALKWFTLATMTRSFHWKRAPLSPIKNRQTSSYPFTPTLLTIPRRAAWKPTT